MAMHASMLWKVSKSATGSEKFPKAQLVLESFHKLLCGCGSEKFPKAQLVLESFHKLLLFWKVFKSYMVLKSFQKLHRGMTWDWFCFPDRSW
jgi:hypothetical protein